MITRRTQFAWSLVVATIISGTGTAQDVVDSLRPLRKKAHTEQRVADTISHDALANSMILGSQRARRKVAGYRVQIFTGGNDRAAKRTAMQLKEKVQKYFPELSAYVHFQSPRWICRVGDFVSREEAARYAKLIRRARISAEAAVEASPVLRAY